MGLKLCVLLMEGDAVEHILDALPEKRPSQEQITFDEATLEDGEMAVGRHGDWTVLTDPQASTVMDETLPCALSRNCRVWQAAWHSTGDVYLFARYQDGEPRGWLCRGADNVDQFGNPVPGENPISPENLDEDTLADLVRDLTGMDVFSREVTWMPMRALRAVSGSST